jgi:hypothetical protein
VQNLLPKELLRRCQCTTMASRQPLLLPSTTLAATSSKACNGRAALRRQLLTLAVAISKRALRNPPTRSTNAINVGRAAVAPVQTSGTLVLRRPRPSAPTLLPQAPGGQQPASQDYFQGNSSSNSGGGAQTSAILKPNAPEATMPTTDDLRTKLVFTLAAAFVLCNMGEPVPSC